MRLYLAFLSNEFQSNLAYKTDVLLKMLGRLMGLFVHVAVWVALFHYTTVAETSMGPIRMEDMITYAVISSCISIFISTEGVFRIGDRIRSGDIAIDLMKPIHLHFCLLFQSAGGNLARIVFELIPLIAVAFLLFPVQFPSAALFLVFILSLINGFLLNFLLAYIVGLIGFWYLSIYHLHRLLGDVVRLFSGAWIPLWFFPGWLAELSLFLPFRLIYFSPISIYLGKAGLGDALLVVVQQVLWIGILSLIAWLVWRKGIGKLVIQGG